MKGKSGKSGKPRSSQHYSRKRVNIISAKRKREEDKAKKESMDKGISNYFTKGPITAAQPKAKV